MRREGRRTSRGEGGETRLLNWRVIGAAVVIASAMLLVTVVLLLVTRPPRSARGSSTAVVTVIAANTPTLTPDAAAGTQPADGSGDLPTPQPGVISIGAHVQIVGTDGAGLRLRDQPGLSGTVLIVGSEAEVFRVEDGPKELDGYTWWYLVGPFDENRRGWGVTNYLEIVQNP